MDRVIDEPGFLPAHGGDVAAASLAFGIPVDQWLDLSTGINPDVYPVPHVPQSFFSDLPGAYSAQLVEAACDYYGADTLLVGAGSQAFIEIIPRLFSRPSRVAVPDIGFLEHRKCWIAQGHSIVEYDGFQPASLDSKIAADEVDCAVLINPNNPSAARVDVAMLDRWRQLLLARNGILVVDEAFIDCDPDNSCVRISDMRGIIILRSLGKYFGLAGLRVGFALGDPLRLSQIENHLGLWSVSGVAQFVATQALLDRAWQQQARFKLAAARDHLYKLLSHYFTTDQLHQSHSFVSVLLERGQAITLYTALAKKGILLRFWSLSDSRQALLRFGLLPHSDAQSQQRVAQAIEGLVLQPPLGYHRKTG